MLKFFCLTFFGDDSSLVRKPALLKSGSVEMRIKVGFGVRFEIRVWSITQGRHGVRGSLLGGVKIGISESTCTRKSVVSTNLGSNSLPFLHINQQPTPAPKHSLSLLPPPKRLAVA